MLTIHHAIEKITQQLQSLSPTPRLEAELLITDILKKNRSYLWAHPETIFSHEQEDELQNKLQRRLSGEPLAYILGHQDFWSLRFEVNPATLIPRPETEMLVEWALKSLPEKENLQIADLGTGSGAIALALGYERPRWQIDATDQSKAALLIAEKNKLTHHINNVNFYCGDFLEALPKKKYHAIFSNPPYIAENNSHLKDLLFEPIKALVSGTQGLDALQYIILQARSYLVDGGYLILEHGFDQGEYLVEFMQKAGYQDVTDYKDFAHIPRMVVGLSHHLEYASKRRNKQYQKK